MIHPSTLKVLSLLVALVGPVLGAACSSRQPQTVTETGNPSLVDPGKIVAELEGGVARVIGSEGAVPADATVTITNERTSQRAQTTADASGAFDVSIQADLGDDLNVEVEHDGTSADATVDVVEPGATTESCSTLIERVVEGVASYDAVDRTCEVDDDCRYEEPIYDCYQWVCPHGIAVSRDGQHEILARLEDVQVGCSELEGAGCSTLAVPECPLPPWERARCDAGQCVPVEVVPETCDEWAEQASEGQRQVGRLIVDRDEACESDSDCVLVDWTLSCTGCPNDASVHRSAADAVRSAIAQIEEASCGSFYDQECVKRSSGCTTEPLWRAVCEDGNCGLRTP